MVGWCATQGWLDMCRSTQLHSPKRQLVTRVFVVWLLRLPPKAGWQPTLAYVCCCFLHLYVLAGTSGCGTAALLSASVLATKCADWLLFNLKSTAAPLFVLAGTSSCGKICAGTMRSSAGSMPSTGNWGRCSRMRNSCLMCVKSRRAAVQSGSS